MQEEGGADETEEDDDGGSGSADEKDDKVGADADVARPATRSQDRRKSARGAKAGVHAGAKRKRGDADGVAEDGESRGGDDGNDDDVHVDDVDADADDDDDDDDVDDGKGDEEASSGEDAEDGPRPAVQRKTEAGGESIDEEPEA